MKALIVATCKTSPGVINEILEKKHYRIDYLQLSEALNAPYMDYNIFHQRYPLRRVED